MSAVSTVRSAADPRRAVRYATGGQASRRSSANRIPAILWLAIGILGLKALRDQALPTAGQTLVLLAGAAVIVLAGTVAPDLVFWSLVALFAASILVDVPYLTGLINDATVQVDKLARFGPGKAA